jgi:hypothetical protein
MGIITRVEYERKYLSIQNYILTDNGRCQYWSE